MRKKGLLKLIVGITLVAVLAISIPLMSGCRPAPEEAAPAEAEVLKIGLATALTGWGACYGVPQTAGWQYWQEKINSEGGIQIGDKLYTIELIIEDTRYEVDLSRTAGEKLILRDKCKFISSPGTPIDSTIESLARENKVIQMDISGFAPPAMIAADHPYIWDAMTSFNFGVRGILAYVKEQYPDLKRVVRIGVDAEYDHAYEVDNKKGIAALAPWAEWAGETWYEHGTVDFMPTVSGVLAHDPDLVIIGLLSADNLPVLKTVRDQGYDGVVVMGDVGFGLPVMLEGLSPAEVSKYFDNTYCHSTEYYPLAPVVVEYKEWCEAKGIDWSSFAYGFQMVPKIFFAGLQAAGTIDDPDAICNAIEQVEVPYKSFPGEPMAYFSGEETYGIKRVLVGPTSINVVEEGEVVTLKTNMYEFP